jgi:hypothetical protein
MHQSDLHGVFSSLNVVGAASFSYVRTQPNAVGADSVVSWSIASRYHTIDSFVNSH